MRQRTRDFNVATSDEPVMIHEVEFKKRIQVNGKKFMKEILSGFKKFDFVESIGIIKIAPAFQAPLMVDISWNEFLF